MATTYRKDTYYLKYWRRAGRRYVQTEETISALGYFWRRLLLVPLGIYKVGGPSNNVLYQP